MGRNYLTGRDGDRINAARRCRLQLQPAPALVRGALTRPLVDPLPRPLGRPALPNPVPQNFPHGRLEKRNILRRPERPLSPSPWRVWNI